MFLLKIVDDYYLTADSTNFLLCRWNGYEYINKKVKQAYNFRNLTDADRIPKFTGVKKFRSLADAFDSIYIDTQKYAFHEADNLIDMIDILKQTRDSIVYLKSKVETAFEQDKKEHKQKTIKKDCS